MANRTLKRGVGVNYPPAGWLARKRDMWGVGEWFLRLEEAKTTKAMKHASLVSLFLTTTMISPRN